MTSAFQELCRNVKLTKSEKAMAEYILANFREVCFLTSSELADKVNSSHSSVIRFAKDLGFRGYSELQQEIRRQYDSYISSHDEASTIPAEKLSKSLEKLDRDDIAEALRETMRNNIQYTMLNNSHETLEKASEAIINAKMKYIIGYRGCAAITAFLQIILRDTLPGVFAAESKSLNVFDFLLDVSDADAVIIITFPRYNKEALLAAQLAKEAGATVIVMTDKLTAPITEYADHVLLAEVDSLTFFNSQIAPMFLAELLCSYVCRKVGKGNEDKLKLVDKYTKLTENF